MKAAHSIMHGIDGDVAWPAPMMVVKCDAKARPGYQTGAAHEYMDQPDVLKAKVRALADMVRQSEQFITYTGAGISTAAGVNDYATKAGASSVVAKSGGAGSGAGRKVAPLSARPTAGHCVLTQLERSGHLKHWVQQNHDGLPQKAGYPQTKINEIHGAWFDPSNPVVPMKGSLRSDLMDWLLEWEERSDLGTSSIALLLSLSLCSPWN